MKKDQPNKEKIFRILSNCDFFAGLPEEFLLKVALSSEIKQYRKKSSIFCEGAKAKQVYILASGSVQLQKNSASGSITVIRTVKPFEIFAEAVLFEKENYPVTALAISNSIVIAINREEIHKLMENKEFRNAYLKNISLRLRYLADKVKTLANCDIEQRFFLFLSEQYGQRETIRVEISKKDIAAAIGAVPESFSRMLKRLESRSLIRWQGKTLNVSEEAWKTTEF